MSRPPTSVLAVAVTSVFLFARPSTAQQPQQPGPEQMQQMQQMMGPMMAQMASVTLEATLTTLQKPENAERLADFTKHYYDALIKRGFTKEEALHIVVATGIPRPMPQGR